MAESAAIWPRCVRRLEAELSSEDLNMWVRPLHAQERDGVLWLLAPNSFVRDAVRRQLLEAIRAAVEQLEPGQFSVEVAVGGIPEPTEAKAPESQSTQRHDSGRNNRRPSGVDPRYCFENFVQGKSNQLGRAAAMQVSENPGDASYNPLLLYGGTGLGKTHLLHAVGNRLLADDSERRVVYMHSEQFVSEMIQALRHNTIDAFKNLYRSVDALLIDDIQFLAGKERSQEEFFHTFNSLLESKQQIVLTCDRYPKEVEGLESRLKSRFGWGLSVAIEPPDFETRAAILISKASVMDVPLPEEVAFFMAKHIRSNVRDLEGALNTLMANARFTGQGIDMPFARETLRDLLSVHEKLITIGNIQRTVADYFEVRVADLLSKRRNRSIARPRQMAMALAKELTDHSLPEIGDSFGGRDHTTVLHACRKVAELRDGDARIREDYAKLLRLLTT